MDLPAASKEAGSVDAVQASKHKLRLVVALADNWPSGSNTDNM